MRLDADVVAWLKQAGPGYQTRADQILREKMVKESAGLVQVRALPGLGTELQLCHPPTGLFRVTTSKKQQRNLVAHPACPAQDLQFLARTHTIRIRNRPAKQVGDQRWLNQHSMNRGSTRQSVLCAVSASPECLMNRGELHRLRTGSPAHRPRPSGSDFFCPKISYARIASQLRML
jgi:hypothetical protein